MQTEAPLNIKDWKLPQKKTHLRVVIKRPSSNSIMKQTFNWCYHLIAPSSSAMVKPHQTEELAPTFWCTYPPTEQ